MGVFKQGNRYRARFHRGGKTINVGSFKTKEEATEALNKVRGDNMKTEPNMRLEDFSTPFVKTKPSKSLWERFKDWIWSE